MYIVQWSDVRGSGSDMDLFLYHHEITESQYNMLMVCDERQKINFVKNFYDFSRAVEEGRFKPNLFVREVPDDPELAKIFINLGGKYSIQK